jgi:hypothetical protein
MTYKDSIEWLKSLKNQISQSQHQDLWHFEQAIDEIILKLQPLAKPHGDLIDRDTLPLRAIDKANFPSNYIKIAPTIIEKGE